MFEELIQIYALHLTGYIESRYEAAVFLSVIRVLGPLIEQQYTVVTMATLISYCCPVHHVGEG